MWYIYDFSAHYQSLSLLNPKTLNFRNFNISPKVSVNIPDFLRDFSPCTCRGQQLLGHLPLGTGLWTLALYHFYPEAPFLPVWIHQYLTYQREKEKKVAKESSCSPPDRYFPKYQNACISSLQNLEHLLCWMVTLLISTISGHCLFLCFPSCPSFIHPTRTTLLV